MTEDIKIAVQCGSLGDRCGINTYTQRVVENLNKIDGISAFAFKDRFRKSQNVDLINIQYEPGMCQPNVLNGFLQKYSQPIVITVHHSGLIHQFYPMVDGLIYHSNNQIPIRRYFLEMRLIQEGTPF